MNDLEKCRFIVSQNNRSLWVNENYCVTNSLYITQMYMIDIFHNENNTKKRNHRYGFYLVNNHLNNLIID